MTESTLSRNLTIASQLSIDDIVSFDYGGKTRKGPISKITDQLITVEVNDSNSKYKSFRFNRMKSVITQHIIGVDCDTFVKNEVEKLRNKIDLLDS